MGVTWLLACRFAEDDARPGVLRLGPPEPSVGAYGVAATAERVFVSNLHVPWITLVDPATGAREGAIDLRDCVPAAFFPRLFTYGGALWVTALDQQRACRYDLDTLAMLEPVELEDAGEAIVATDDGLWTSGPDVLRRHDGDAFVEAVDVGLWASAADVTGEEIAVVARETGEVRLLARDGTPRWATRLAETTLNAVLVHEGRVLLADRLTGDVIALEGGAEVGRIHTGSDTFSLYRHEDLVLVTNRQGAALPPSGAYEGGPARVTALTWDLEVAWTVDLSKTIHFLAWDGRWWWTANEDALRMSAIDPETGTEALRGPPLGLTLDHVAPRGGRLFLGSHLTDEVWRADFEAREAVAVATCGWPFVTAFAGDAAWAPCQETGELFAFDPDTMTAIETVAVADTFMPPCPDGLCTAHDALVGAAVAGGELVFTDAHTGAVRWLDGDAVDLGDFAEMAAHVQHFDVAPLGEGVLAFEPRSASLYLVGAQATAQPADVTTPLPLVPDGDGVWAGDTRWGEGLVATQTLPEGMEAVAAGEDVVVAVDGDDVVVVEAGEEVARLPVLDLRSPPLPTISGELGPLRFAVDGEELLVANVMLGTLERRALPTLAPLGGEEIVAVGTWE